MYSSIAYNLWFLSGSCAVCYPLYQELEFDDTSTGPKAAAIPKSGCQWVSENEVYLQVAICTWKINEHVLIQWRWGNLNFRQTHVFKSNTVCWYIILHLYLYFFRCVYCCCFSQWTRICTYILVVSDMHLTGRCIQWRRFVRTAHALGWYSLRFHSTTRRTASISMDCRFRVFSISMWPCDYCYYPRLVHLQNCTLYSCKLDIVMILWNPQIRGASLPCLE